MSTARIGSLVHTKVDPRINNDEGVAMAFVTRVKEVKEEEDVDVLLNLRILLDTGADLRRTGVKLVDGQPEENDENVDSDSSGTQRVAWLPKD